ncbi:hypothetical protein [Streptomyces aureoverticillatus]|nr:hypothetical protein [Streptomyces aureoverticillatus]
MSEPYPARRICVRHAATTAGSSPLLLAHEHTIPGATPTPGPWYG